MKQLLQEQSGLQPKLNWMKWRKISWLALGAMVLVLSHQNCAPAQGGSGAPSNSLSGSSPVTIIDSDKAGMELSFNSSSVLANSALTVIDVPGNCSSTQEGAVLGWKLEDASGNELSSGLSPCSNSQFMVNIASAQSLQCGVNYQVIAQLGAGAPAQISVSRDCSSN
jgi:hypothetical protein